MHLGDDDPGDDGWLLHWVGAAFRVGALRTSKKPWKIGLAVSGGSDSIAMLHLFARSAVEQNYQLSVATVDHGLRPEAADEARFVAKTCQSLGIAHQTLKWSDWDGKGNLQAKARDARYALLAGWAKEAGLKTIALGHTQNDQAETFLARLARGSGLDGLACMEDIFHRHDVEFARPCLMLEREMLRRYLRRYDLEWRDDPSNYDENYQRVRARKVLAALEPLGIDAQKLALTAMSLGGTKRTLGDLTRFKAKGIIVFDQGDLVLKWDDFAAAGYEIGRRILGRALQWVGQTEYPPRAQSISDMHSQILRRKTGTLNRCFVVSTRKEIRISRELQVVKDQSCKSDQPWDNRWLLDGPHAPDLVIRALGPIGLPQCPDWRDVDLPRTSLLASPAVWREEELIAAPLANLNPKWHATLLRDEKQFFSTLFAH